MVPGGIIDETIAQGIIQQRAGPDGVDGTDDDIPFQNTGELINVPGLNPQVVGQLGQIFSVNSTSFQVEVNAQIGTTKRRYIALLWRNQTAVQILQMHWE